MSSVKKLSFCVMSVCLLSFIVVPVVRGECYPPCGPCEKCATDHCVSKCDLDCCNGSCYDPNAKRCCGNHLCDANERCCGNGCYSPDNCEDCNTATGQKFSLCDSNEHCDSGACVAGPPGGGGGDPGGGDPGGGGSDPGGGGGGGGDPGGGGGDPGGGGGGGGGGSGCDPPCGENESCIDNKCVDNCAINEGPWLNCEWPTFDCPPDCSSVQRSGSTTDTCSENYVDITCGEDLCDYRQWFHDVENNCTKETGRCIYSCGVNEWQVQWNVAQHLIIGARHRTHDRLPGDEGYQAGCDEGTQGKYDWQITIYLHSFNGCDSPISGYCREGTSPDWVESDNSTCEDIWWAR
jgi:hypothetical protein